MPLDRTIQEVEAQLPDLRHLLAQGEMVLATSESAALLSDELEFLLVRAGDVAHRLRHLLLGGNLTDIMGSQSQVPRASPALPQSASVMETADAPPVDATEDRETNAWSEMDEELARILNIEVPNAETADSNEAEAEEAPMDPAGKRLLDELRRRYNLTDTPLRPGEMLPGEQELRALEEKLGIADRPLDPAQRRTYLEQLETLAREVVDDQEAIERRWREIRDRPDDLPGGAAVGARIGPPPTPRAPGSERTFAEAEAPPRDP